MEKKRIEEKINEINEYLNELENSTPENLEYYKSDKRTRRICERVAEILIESLVDLAFLFISAKNLELPENDEFSFTILEKSKIISNELATRLREAKGMRNIIAHEYGKVNDEIVFNSIKDELPTDTLEFIKNIQQALGF